MSAIRIFIVALAIAVFSAFIAVAILTTDNFFEILRDYIYENKTMTVIATIVTILGLPSAIYFFYERWGKHASITRDIKSIVETLTEKYQSQLTEKDEQIKALTESLTEAVTALSQAHKTSHVSAKTVDIALNELKKGNTEKAKALFSQVLKEKVAEGKAVNREAAAAARHLGALAFLNNTQEALDAYRRATELDPDNPESWHMLGKLLERIGELRSAEQAYEKVLVWAGKNNDEKVQAVIYGDLGTLYAMQGNLQKAKDMLLKSLKIAKVLNFKEEIADNYARLGNIYLIRKDLQNAEEMYLKSFKIEKKLGRIKNMADICGNIGILYVT